MKRPSLGRIGSCILVAMMSLVVLPSPSNASVFVQEDDPQAQA
jgi:hypothetical protein